MPLERFLEIRGLSDVKIIRIAAAFEIARRSSREDKVRQYGPAGVCTNATN